MRTRSRRTIRHSHDPLFDHSNVFPLLPRSCYSCTSQCQRTSQYTRVLLRGPSPSYRIAYTSLSFISPIDRSFAYQALMPHANPEPVSPAVQELAVWQKQIAFVTNLGQLPSLVNDGGRDRLTFMFKSNGTLFYLDARNEESLSAVDRTPFNEVRLQYPYPNRDGELDLTDKEVKLGPFIEQFPDYSERLYTRPRYGCSDAWQELVRRRACTRQVALPLLLLIPAAALATTGAAALATTGTAPLVTTGRRPLVPPRSSFAVDVLLAPDVRPSAFEPLTLPCFAPTTTMAPPASEASSGYGGERRTSQSASTGPSSPQFTPRSNSSDSRLPSEASSSKQSVATLREP